MSGSCRKCRTSPVFFRDVFCFAQCDERAVAAGHCTISFFSSFSGAFALWVSGFRGVFSFDYRPGSGPRGFLYRALRIGPSRMFLYELYWRTYRLCSMREERKDEDYFTVSGAGPVRVEAVNNIRGKIMRKKGISQIPLKVPG
jgi:hypothetical protein